MRCSYAGEMHYESPRKINDLVGRAREIALSQALAAAGSWVRTKAFQGANQGSMNVHSAYVNVLHHLMKPSQGKIDPASLIDITSLIKQLDTNRIPNRSARSIRARVEVVNS